MSKKKTTKKTAGTKIERKAIMVDVKLHAKLKKECAARKESGQSTQMGELVEEIVGQSLDNDKWVLAYVKTA